ncbi:MAG: S1 family peptidase, partial [Myxococcaceae bacterium]
EDDAYDRDDIPISRLVNDPVIDVSIVKALTPLRILPWRIGRSAALKARNVVEVRGFPLGAFRATSTGKVIAPYDPHVYRDGEHADFVIDALLAQGNSGSPVLAVSCETGEYELVGVFHAAYTRGAALNVVVGIDQIRDLMNTLKRTIRPKDAADPTTPADRERLLVAAKQEPEPFFAFGPLTAAVRVSPEGALLFEVFNDEFPSRVIPLMMLEDAEIPAVPGAVAGTSRAPDYRIFFGGTRGLKGYAWSTLDAEAMAQVEKMREALRNDALLSFDIRAGQMERNKSRERFDALTRLDRKLKKVLSARKDLTSALEDLSERLGPAEGEAGLTLAESLLAPIRTPTVPLRVEGGPPTRPPKRGR